MCTSSEMLLIKAFAKMATSVHGDSALLLLLIVTIVAVFIVMCSAAILLFISAAACAGVVITYFPHGDVRVLTALATTEHATAGTAHVKLLIFVNFATISVHKPCTSEPVLALGTSIRLSTMRNTLEPLLVTDVGMIGTHTSTSSRTLLVTAFATISASEPRLIMAVVVILMIVRTTTILHLIPALTRTGVVIAQR